MTKSARDIIVLMVLVAYCFVGCASKSKFEHIEDDCERAKAYEAEMLESVRLYYALGSTNVAEIAVAERRLRKAREEVIEACGEASAIDIPDSLMDGKVPGDE
jgi:hypothetical protein